MIFGFNAKLRGIQSERHSALITRLFQTSVLAWARQFACRLVRWTAARCQFNRKAGCGSCVHPEATLWMPSQKVGPSLSGARPANPPFFVIALSVCHHAPSSHLAPCTITAASTLLAPMGPRTDSISRGPGLGIRTRSEFCEVVANILVHGEGRDLGKAEDLFEPRVAENLRLVVRVLHSATNLRKEGMCV